MIALQVRKLDLKDHSFHIREQKVVTAYVRYVPLTICTVAAGAEDVFLKVYSSTKSGQKLSVLKPNNLQMIHCLDKIHKLKVNRRIRLRISVTLTFYNKERAMLIQTST